MRDEAKLIAVLCGHIHTAQAHSIRGDWAKMSAGPNPLALGCVQYSTDASVSGGSRTLCFEPTAGTFATQMVADIRYWPYQSPLDQVGVRGLFNQMVADISRRQGVLAGFSAVDNYSQKPRL